MKSRAAVARRRVERGGERGKTAEADIPRPTVFGPQLGSGGVEVLRAVRRNHNVSRRWAEAAVSRRGLWAIRTAPGPYL